MGPFAPTPLQLLVKNEFANFIDFDFLFGKLQVNEIPFLCVLYLCIRIGAVI